MDLSKYSEDLIKSSYDRYRGYSLNFFGRLKESNGLLIWKFPERYEFLVTWDPVFVLAHSKLSEYHREFFKSILLFTAGEEIPNSLMIGIKI